MTVSASNPVSSSWWTVTVSSRGEFEVVDLDLATVSGGEFERDRHDVGEVDVVGAGVRDRERGKRYAHTLQRRLDQIGLASLVGIGDVGEAADSDCARLAAAIGYAHEEVAWLPGGVEGASIGLRHPKCKRGKGRHVAACSRNLTEVDAWTCLP